MNYEFTALPLSYQPNTGGRYRNRTCQPISEREFSKLLSHLATHLPNSGTQWRNRTSTSAFVAQRDHPFHQSGIGTSWQIRTADLLRVKETFYHWNNEAHLAESRGVEPHPISENPVFKAGRSTITAALLSINLVANSGFEPLTNTLSRYCSTSELIGYEFFSIKINKMITIIRTIIAPFWFSLIWCCLVESNYFQWFFRPPLWPHQLKQHWGV